MLQRLPAGTPLEPLFAALEAEGAVIVERLIDKPQCGRIEVEFRPWLDREGLDSAGEFNGFKTLRISQIVARSPASLPLLEHPLVLATADRFLLKNCLNYQFGSLTGIEILPGEGEQRLHRDHNCYWKRFEGMEMQVSALWALDDFTLENGATRVIPGSHRWPLDRFPQAGDPVVQAAMPAGSLLLYLGSTYHGGGANRSNAARLALINTYALGWLRQEENMYLSVPRETADALPEQIRLLLGYRRHGLVGWYPGAPEN